MIDARGGSSTVTAPSVGGRLAPIAGRVLPLTLYTIVMFSQFRAAIRDGVSRPGLHMVLSAALTCLFAAATLRRSAPVRRGSLVGAGVAVIGLVSVTLIGLLSAAHRVPASRLAAADTLIICGLVFSVICATSLGACFGVLPDARGLVTAGPYRLVRHPLYLGEIVSALGVALGTDRVVIGLAGWVALVVVQMLRARFEEQTLRAAFDEYVRYAQTTRWRIIPFVF
jgi:protein-S-isoprenylcysteine O-methyltransferase Ste14